MPSSKEHEEKAAQNRACLNSLLSSTGDPVWMSVIAFYTALHLVERLAAKENKHNSKHQDRLNYLIKHKQHRAIHPNFQSLYDASLVARYLTVKRFNTAYPGSTVIDQLVNTHLVAIEAYVNATFAPPFTPASGAVGENTPKPAMRKP